MKKTSILTIISIVLFTSLISGCANTPVQITEQMVDTAGNVIGSTTKTISDASVGKEESVHVTLRNRDNQIAASAKNAGMKMKWVSVTETIQVPGQQSIVMTRSMPEVSYTPQAEFTQPLPTAPSEHPIYRTIENLGGKVVDGSLIGYTVKQGAGVLKAGLREAGDNFTASGEGSTASKVDNNASNGGTINGGGKDGETSGECIITDSIALSDCRSTTQGQATLDEWRSCLRDYGYTDAEIAKCPL